MIMRLEIDTILANILVSVVTCNRTPASLSQTHSTGWSKKIGTILFYTLTLSNINRFTKLFH